MNRLVSYPPSVKLPSTPLRPKYMLSFSHRNKKRSFVGNDTDGSVLQQCMPKTAKVRDLALSK